MSVFLDWNSQNVKKAPLVLIFIPLSFGIQKYGARVVIV